MSLVYAGSFICPEEVLNNCARMLPYTYGCLRRTLWAMSDSIRRVVALIGLFCVLVLLAATMGGTATAKTLLVGLSNEPGDIDPHFASHTSAYAVVEALFDSLVIADYDGRIVPHLAESWTVLDETTVEFRLRQDVVFHNGEPFDARSVKYSLERVTDPELQTVLRSAFVSVKDVDIVDAYTVHVNLHEPDSSLLWNLTRLAMVPVEYTERVGDVEFGRRPVGTGPFRFVEWVRDSHVLLEANPDYFTGGLKGTPQVEHVLFRVVPERATRLAELRTGGLHLIERISADAVQLVQRADLAVAPADSGRFYVAWFRIKEGSPLADKRVRQALNYAMNTEAIVQVLFGGYASALATPFTSSTFGYQPDLPPYPYDPDKARQLLAEAGYGNGLSLTLDVTTGSAEIGQLIAGQLAEVGVAVTLRPLEVSIFNANWVSGQTSDMVGASWGGAGDPQAYLEALIHSEGFLSGYSNPKADELIAVSARTLDADERMELLYELQEVLYDDPAAIYLWSVADIYAHSPALKNWRPHPTERLIIGTATVAD